MTTCAVCNEKIGVLTGKVKLYSGEVVCKKCTKKAGFSTSNLEEIGKIQRYSASQIKNMIDNPRNLKDLSASDFQPTQKLDNYVHFDDNNEKMAYTKGLFNLKPNHYIDYKDIKDFDIIENQETILKSGLDTALAGGALFGVTGAVIGAITGKGKKKKDVVNRLEIVLVTTGKEEISIPFITSEIKVNSIQFQYIQPLFKNAVEKIQSIVEKNNK